MSTSARIASVLLACAVVPLAACGENHAPALVPPADRSIPVGGLLMFDVQATDPDGDAVKLALVDAPAGVTLDGAMLMWTPAAADLGAHGVVVSATDDGDPALAAYASFTITVFDPAAAPNHAPEILLVPDVTVAAGEAITIPLTAADPDGDALTWASLALPPGATFDPRTATFTWTPTLADGGHHAAVFLVTDDGRPPLHAQLMVRIAVTVPASPNLPPVFVNRAPPATTDPCVPYSARFTALDPEGTPVRYTAPSLPPGATLTTDGYDAVLTWTPSSGQAGDRVIAIYATDEGSPAMSTVFVVPLAVTAPPPLVIAPIADAIVAGGTTGAMSVDYPHHPCYRMKVDATLPATWDADAGVLRWTPGRDAFGIYASSFRLDDVSDPTRHAKEVGRWRVQYVDELDGFDGWAVRDVNLDWCCQGTVGYGATDGVLHASSALGVDVHGYAYRVFGESALPIAGVAYDFTGYDVVVGPACGSGAALGLYDRAVTDPAVTWPAWGDETAPTVAVGLPDGNLTRVQGVAELPAPAAAVTVALQHADNSNICTLDAYWSRVVLTPIATTP